MAFKIRAGVETRDLRLDRIQQFDKRSKAYPIRELVEAKGAVSPVTKSWACRKFLDQGTEGACVGFAWGHELIANTVVVNVGNTFARESIYWEAQKIDEWGGGAYPGADPFYEGTSVLAGAKVIRKLGYITEYRWAFGLEDLVLAVGHQGPAVIGIPWYDGMFNVWGCGYVHVTGQVAGGHAILVKGVNVEKRNFTLHNSWGKSWGRNGKAKISWDDMDRLLGEGGEACIPVGRKSG